MVPRWGQREFEEFPQWQPGLHLLLNLHWVEILLVLMKNSNMTEDIKVSCQAPHAYGEGRTRSLHSHYSGMGEIIVNWGRQTIGILLMVK